MAYGLRTTQYFSAVQSTLTKQTVVIPTKYTRISSRSAYKVENTRIKNLQNYNII